MAMPPKLDVLRSIAHNLADSLGSGASLLTGQYEVDPFLEAERSANGCIDVDFLRGTVSHGSAAFEAAVRRFTEALPVLCSKHGLPRQPFVELNAQYISRPKPRRFIVMMASADGRRARDQYLSNGSRIRTLDPLGRVRRRRD